MSGDAMIDLVHGTRLFGVPLPLCLATYNDAGFTMFRMQGPATCSVCEGVILEAMGAVYHSAPVIGEGPLAEGHHVHLNCWLVKSMLPEAGDKPGLMWKLKGLWQRATLHTVHHFAWKYFYPPGSPGCTEEAHTYGCHHAGTPWRVSLNHHPMYYLKVQDQLHSYLPYGLKENLPWASS